MKLNTSKGELLNLLSKEKIVFKVPPLNFYTYQDWSKNKKSIISKIKKKYKNKLIALRSSAFDEDKLINSNAGKYKSFLNVNSASKKIKKKIEEIFKSYKKYRPINKKDMFIVQEMVRDLSMSGVIFTKDLETGSNYYVINYDDVTGSSDSVTSGKGELSNRVLYIQKLMTKHVKSKRFKVLIKAVQHLEKIFDYKNLDIEFALDKKLTPYLLQARQLKSFKRKNFFSEKQINNELEKCSKKIFHLQSRNYDGFAGKITFFGNMPDWNPAEIIGNQPNNLAYSLYDYLITKNSWINARNLIGYKKNKIKNLVSLFAGKPYVNIKLSLNSFLPKGLSRKFSEKLIDFWQLKLKSEPFNHDKIEFEIAITCYDFLIKKKLNTHLPNNIKKSEREVFFIKLKELTEKILTEKNGSAALSKQIDQIEIIDKNFKKNTKLKKPKEITNEIQKNLKICRDKGLVSFSILARYAFISISLIKSLVGVKIISENEKDTFLKSVDTITSEFLDDSLKLNKKKISKKNYFKKYGHLRPGTYNLTSKKYEDLDFSKFKNKTFKKNNFRFVLNRKKIIKINKILKKDKIENIDANNLFKFFENSIKWREKGKFIYTKYISYILDLVIQYGKIYKIKKNDLIFLDIEKIIKLEKDNTSNQIKRKKLLSEIKKNKDKFKLSSKVKLPQLIYDKSAPFIIPHIISSPNFVTKKSVVARTVYLKGDENFQIRIENNIVLTENADPGFDWIFQKNIKGLITKYGGANSHMTIRCAELDIPAAIGVGDKKFNELLKENNQIELDCSTKNIGVF